MKKSQRNYHYSWGSIFINRMRGKEKNSVNEESTEQFKEKVG